MRFIRAIYRNQRGATALEYGLIIALVTLAVVVGISRVASTTTNMWNMIATRVATA